MCQVFLGQKYGYRPIPTFILGAEFVQLRETLNAMGTDTILLDTWYRKDVNAVPAVYILQPISSILVNFNNKVMRVMRDFYKRNTIRGDLERNLT